MADNGSQAVGSNLPKFDKSKVYLVTGKSLNNIVQTVSIIEPRVVTGGGLEIASQTDQGTFLKLAAKDIETAAGGAGSVTVTTEDASGYTPGTGVGTVENVTTLTFDQDNFEIFDGGGGQCVVRLKTCDATCPS